MLRIQNSDQVTDMAIVLGKKAEGNSGYRVVSPRLVQAAEQ
jgi:hypothetical protein